MRRETQGEVFEKFVRAKNANSVNTTGTGLGLYIAKKMLEGMQGRLTVESEGEGEYVPHRAPTPAWQYGSAIE